MTSEITQVFIIVHRMISDRMVAFCRGMKYIARTMCKADQAYPVLLRVERLRFSAG